jgi:hypothetical protein
MRCCFFDLITGSNQRQPLTDEREPDNWIPLKTGVTILPMNGSCLITGKNAVENLA